jgi:predicted murein hydrolase (TIGR00659 family)
MSLAASPALILFLIVAVYWLTTHIRQRTGSFWCNPVFLSTVMLIGYLYATDTPYPQFHAAAQFIDFWLQPAVVCLAVPLYVQWQKIRKQWLPILLSQLLGSLVGIVSAVLIAHWMGAERAVTLSLAAKSVTNPIALEITHSIGGIPAITAATVIMAGMLGQMLGFRALQAGRIRNPSSRGMSMGSASHAMGISAALEQSQKLAAYASLGLIFNGVLTAFLVPVVLPLMGF